LLKGFRGPLKKETRFIKIFQQGGKIYFQLHSTNITKTQRNVITKFTQHLLFHLMIIVLDLVSQIRDVVLVRRTFSTGKLQGVGILEWGGDGEGIGMGRSVYEQPGTKVDGILSQQGGFPSK
jgi:hypothetical protein